MTVVSGSAEWQRCRHWIAAALERSPGLETIEDVEGALDCGEYQFFPGRHCAVVTQILSFPRRKVLAVKHGGGDLKELLHTMEPFLCRFARAQGCEAISGEGRMGWMRTAKANGYRLGFITMMKDLHK